MNSLADQSRLHVERVGKFTVSLVGVCKYACRLFLVVLVAGKNVGFYAAMSKKKLIPMFFSCFKLMLAGGRRLLSRALLTVVFLSLGGCQSGESEYIGGDLSGVNHTWDAINRFGVNGYGGGNLQPNGFAGWACCIALPQKWHPGLQVRVDWEVDPNPRASLPSLWSSEYEAAYKKHSAGYRRYSALVDIPQYTIGELCSLKIHFLPCKKLKATTSCVGYGSPDYPIKEPQQMKEPPVCSQIGDA